MLDVDSDVRGLANDADEETAMLANPFPPDDDDDEPEVDEVTSSTRLIDDADRHPPTVVRHRLTGVSASPRSPAGVSGDRSSSPSSSAVNTETANDEQCCCCCCCCNCDVTRTPPACHCQCPAARRFYFRSSTFHSDDDDDDEADNESGCSCCQCNIDVQASNTPAQTGNELLPLATTQLSSMAPISLSGQGFSDVNYRLPSWSAAKDVRSSTAVGSSSRASSGLSSFFAFIRSRGRLWSSGRSAESAASDVGWSRRRARGRGRVMSTSTLPPCTCGLGVHFDPPLSVAQQVPAHRLCRSRLLTRVVFGCSRLIDSHSVCSNAHGEPTTGLFLKLPLVCDSIAKRTVRL